MEEEITELFTFLESNVFPILAQQIRTELASEEQLLPNKLPLKRRFSEFRYGSQNRRPSTLNTPSSFSGQFSTNLWAIEKFRDITPAFVVAIFDDSIILEPGDIGPLPISHPVAKELIKSINTQTIGLAMLERLRESGTPFYDGCVVIGVVDYRRWAFASITTGNKANGEQGNPTSPEMHKILLRCSYYTMMNDIQNLLKNGHSEVLNKLPDELLLEMESKLLKALNNNICLEPNPMISRILTSLNYNHKKFFACLKPETIIPPKQAADRLLRESDYIQETIRTERIEQFKHRFKLFYKTSAVYQQSRYQLYNVIEETRQKKRQQSLEPYYGLDAKKDPLRLGLSSPPNINWLQPHQSLWRTLRFEERRNVDSAIHFTFHVIINLSQVMRSPTIQAIIPHGTPPPSVKFDILLRIGTAPCLGDITDSSYTTFPTKVLAETFIEQLKQSMLMEGKVCVGDVSNPNALAGLMRTGLSETLPSSMLAGAFSMVPPGMMNPTFLRNSNRTIFGSPQPTGNLEEKQRIPSEQQQQQQNKK